MSKRRKKNAKKAEKLKAQNIAAENTCSSDNSVGESDGYVYYIFAGINGAGKTALYKVLDRNIDLGVRISIDDIVREMGDWHDALLQIKGARIAMRKLDECIDKRITFHQETTLPGEAVVKFAKKAKENGFWVVLYYISVDDIDIALERIEKRVEMGGHGIGEEVVRKRYADMYPRLKRLIPVCDEIYFYDNTEKFRQVAMVLSGVTVDCDNNLPNWMVNLFKQDTVDIFSDNDETFE